MPSKKAGLSFLILIISCLPAVAVTRYVSPSGAGAMNGTSWANAFPGTSLQFAISSSIPGDEVWVMSGTYYTTTTANRNIYFSLVNGVAVYGSFNGTETTLSQRSFSCGFSSVLSAEIGAPGNADNSYHVISNSSLNNTCILDGFTIRDGHANFDLLGNDSRSLGGGILNNAANGGTCSPTIRNCLFTNNTAVFGGGIFDHGQNGGNANPVITNCIFTQNTATGGGGGIDNFGYNGNASPVITNCIFYLNTATDRAGAMYCWGGGNGNASPTILNSAFINNSSVDGGAIVADRSNFTSGNSGTATPTIRNSIFWGNTASGAGPQFYIIGGAGFAATYSIVDVSNQNPPHAITGPGTGNIFTAPNFLDISNAIGPDNCWLTLDDGLQLQNGSVGINTGDNTGLPPTDIRNYNRISNGVVDMNPYEYLSGPLAVKWISLFGRPNAKTNLICWSIETNEHTTAFDVERSNDGIQYEKIGEVTAMANHTGELYRFTDERVSQQKHFYRVRQKDSHGQSALSTSIMITNQGNSFDVLLFPNPAREKITVVLPGTTGVNKEFLLFNSNGMLLRKVRIQQAATQVSVADLKPGQYLLVNYELGIFSRFNKIP
ncbi:MAG TPA: T9SS type A sorting domain-containing protein [Ferruginibacter sp.]|nr:T9SS type A sorting domain-containing protein [Ferruginibacter sp.]